MTKQVMTRAWEIAKTAVVKFGGKVKEYFASALTLAWAEVKEMAIEAIEFGIAVQKQSQSYIYVNKDAEVYELQKHYNSTTDTTTYTRRSISKVVATALNKNTGNELKFHYVYNVVNILQIVLPKTGEVKYGEFRTGAFTWLEELEGEIIK